MNRRAEIEIEGVLDSHTSSVVVRFQVVAATQSSIDEGIEPRVVNVEEPKSFRTYVWEGRVGYGNWGTVDMTGVWKQTVR